MKTKVLFPRPAATKGVGSDATARQGYEMTRRPGAGLGANAFYRQPIMSDTLQEPLGVISGTAPLLSARPFRSSGQ